MPRKQGLCIMSRSLLVAQPHESPSTMSSALLLLGTQFSSASHRRAPPPSSSRHRDRLPRGGGHLRVVAGLRPKAPTNKSNKAATAVAPPIPLSSYEFTSDEDAATYNLFVRKAVPPPPPPVPSAQVS